MLCWSNVVDFYLINSSPPSAAYMRQWMGSALVQIMPVRRQAIILNNAGSIGPLRTKFSEIKISEIKIKIKNIFHSQKNVCEMTAILFRGRSVKHQADRTEDCVCFLIRRYGNSYSFKWRPTIPCSVTRYCLCHSGGHTTIPCLLWQLNSPRSF